MVKLASNRNPNDLFADIVVLIERMEWVADGGNSIHAEASTLLHLIEEYGNSMAIGNTE